MSDTRKKLALLAKTSLVTCVLFTAPCSIGAEQAAIESDAVSRLQESMDYVAGLQTFALQTNSTIEVVLESGQKNTVRQRHR